MSGPGTFLPVKADDTSGHRMHAERGVHRAPRSRSGSTRRGGRAGASSRSARRRCGCLKSAADEAGTIQPFDGATDIFITPGYRFRAVDLLMTNFHLPRSTLFMLVAAFSGLATMKARLRARDRGRLPLLLLRRRLPAPSGAAAHERLSVHASPRPTARRAPARSRRRAEKSARRPSCRSARRRR